MSPRESAAREREVHFLTTSSTGTAYSSLCTCIRLSYFSASAHLPTPLPTYEVKNLARRCLVADLRRDATAPPRREQRQKGAGRQPPRGDERARRRLARHRDAEARVAVVAASAAVPLGEVAPVVPHCDGRRPSQRREIDRDLVRGDRRSEGQREPAGGPPCLVRRVEGRRRARPVGATRLKDKSRT